MQFFGIKREWETLKYALNQYRDLRYKDVPKDWIDFNNWEKDYRDSLSKYKSIHRGESCFIIGNGPSLNKMDLTKLNGHYCFGLNKIYLIWDRVDLKLSYYVAVNPFVIEQSKQEIEQNINCPRFISYNASKECIKDHEGIERIYTKGGWEFATNMQSTINEGATVTYVAMQIAYYMGFQKVYLIGVDHNFQQKGKPNETQLMKEEDVNHFDKRYFSGHNWQLADLEASEVGYKMAKYYFEKRGGEVINAGVDSKLDTFRKMSFKEALSNFHH